MADRFKHHMKLASETDALYQATAFWEAGLPLIEKDLASEGYKKFRRWPHSLGFFVPTYGAPGNSLSTNLIEELSRWCRSSKLTKKQTSFLVNWAQGETLAKQDFRVLKSSVMTSNNEFLLQFSESAIGEPIEQFEIAGTKHSRSSLNYLMGLACLGKFVELKTITRIVELGGGYGTLGEIVNQLWPSNAKYINFDIPPICNVSEFYLNSLTKDFNGIDDMLSMQNISMDYLKRINVAPNWKIKDATGPIDLFVNMISFQEMEKDVVENYCKKLILLNPKFVLLRHIREGKQKKTSSRPAGVIKPTTSRIYDRILDGYALLHRDSSPFGFDTPDGFHSDVLIYRKLG